MNFIPLLDSLGGMLISLVIILFWLMLFAVILVFGVFYLWMLIDAIRRNNYTGKDDKILWIVLFIFTGWLGAILYYFIIKRKLDNK